MQILMNKTIWYGSYKYVRIKLLICPNYVPKTMNLSVKNL